jgi:phosphoglycolate phosphatase
VNNVPKKAVIFDLDGTLINSLDDIANSMNEALRANGYPLHSVESYKHFIGTGVVNLVKNALPPEKKEDERAVNTVRESYRMLYEKNYLEKTKPYDGINELLNTLKQQGFKIAVLSNKPHGFTVELAEHFFEGIDFILGQQDSIPKKPDPAGVNIILKELKLSKEDCIYLGDSGVDMQTAKAAGMTAVGVLWGFREKEELLENGADYLIEKPQDLLNLPIQAP